MDPHPIDLSGPDGGVKLHFSCEIIIIIMIIITSFRNVIFAYFGVVRLFMITYLMPILDIFVQKQHSGPEDPESEPKNILVRHTNPQS